MGVKVQDKMRQQCFALHQKVSWIASQPLLPSTRRRGHSCQHIIINRAGFSLQCIHPHPSSSTSRGYSIPRHMDHRRIFIIITSQSFPASQSSLILLQFIVAVNSFSNSFPCCAKCFFKKYIPKGVQQVTVKNNPRKQKQIKKSNSRKKSRSSRSRCLELISYID